MHEIRQYLPVALLAVGCVLVSGVRGQEKVPPRTHMAAIPVTAPGYVSRDTIIADEEQRVAGMSDYVLRLFRRDTTDHWGFSVYVGYYDYQVQGKTIHSPKNCLPGAGWEQLNASVESVPVENRAYPVNRFLLANKGQQALVYYWYQGRGRLEANEYRVKFNLLHDAALYGRTEEALVRIVVSLDPAVIRRDGPAPTYASADSLAKHVAMSLIPAVTRALPAAPGT